MILVDADGQIVHANAAGRHVCRAPTFSQTAGGRLIAGDVRSIRRCARSPSPQPRRHSAGVKGIALPLAARNGEHYVAHVFR